MLGGGGGAPNRILAPGRLQPSFVPDSPALYIQLGHALKRLDIQKEMSQVKLTRPMPPGNSNFLWNYKK